jgi:hypothetical protein
LIANCTLDPDAAVNVVEASGVALPDARTSNVVFIKSPSGSATCASKTGAELVVTSDVQVAAHGEIPTLVGAAGALPASTTANGYHSLQAEFVPSLACTRNS